MLRCEFVRPSCNSGCTDTARFNSDEQRVQLVMLLETPRFKKVSYQEENYSIYKDIGTAHVTELFSICHQRIQSSHYACALLQLLWNLLS